MQPTQPRDASVARALLAASPAPFDSPTPRRHRTTAHLDPMFANGRRRPEWVWSATAPGGEQAVVAALGDGDDTPSVIDYFGLSGHAETDATLLRHALTRGRELGAGAVEVSAPAGATFADARLDPWREPLLEAGWSLLVERLHYEFEPPAELGLTVPVGLEFEALTSGDDPRFVALSESLLVGSLDAHDGAALARFGLTGAAARLRAQLLADPCEFIRIAWDPLGEGRTPVGLVSWNVFPGTGRGFVMQVGVAATARGHGYGRRMLAHATRQMLADGAQVLVADTDFGNVPMARAFADVGWVVTETRLDFECGVGV
ncbi:GNAT family N-acetyltransferase [Micrococcales bacterium 31B]|nr:GNAT family N-acetyltransferase [Micrococcales bacterium 31B]